MEICGASEGGSWIFELNSFFHTCSGLCYWADRHSGMFWGAPELHYLDFVLLLLRQQTRGQNLNQTSLFTASLLYFVNVRSHSSIFMYSCASGATSLCVPMCLTVSLTPTGPFMCNAGLCFLFECKQFFWLAWMWTQRTVPVPTVL